MQLVVVLFALIQTVNVLVIFQTANQVFRGYSAVNKRAAVIIAR